jgi:hypothetical protein
MTRCSQICRINRKPVENSFDLFEIMNHFVVCASMDKKTFEKYEDILESPFGSSSDPSDAHLEQIRAKKGTIKKRFPHFAGFIVDLDSGNRKEFE